MAITTTIGLDRVEIGAIAPDGGMGTTLVEVGTTVLGTAVITKEQPTVTPINIEESDAALFTTVTGGNFGVSWSTYNVDPTMLQRIFGGTVTGTGASAVWAAAANTPILEVSVRMTSKTGLVASMPRVQLNSDLALNFQKETAGQINIIGTVLVPTKADTAPITIGQVAAG